jgi:DNA-binding Lrp family transcriptional regulator
VQEVMQENEELNTYQNEEIISHLQMVVEKYLKENPTESINSLSKKCAISEPTLRRVYKGQVKTLPTVTTIVDILSYLASENQVDKLLQIYPGPLAQFIRDKMGQVEEVENVEFSEHLTQALNDPVKYLIYKLAANNQGVTDDKVIELFGRYGESQLQELLSQNLIYQIDGAYFARIENFALSHDVFVKHFKAVADFIKPHKHAQASKAYSPIFYNYSASLTKEAYSAILRIQRMALKKILKVIADDSSQGHIPTFVIGAVDTIDDKCADEY